MSGIAGIFAYHESAPSVDGDELLHIRDAMIKRGPDGAGLWISDDARIGLAHRRLAVIDLSEMGAQPMWNVERTLCVTFNGTIYNYRELKRGLEAKGYRFRSASDTEVLLRLYEDQDQEMVHALRGMYAFAIWDARNKGLFLARDHFGIKPLYYADDGNSFRFASQVKALLKGNNIDIREDPAGYVGFYVWGSVPEPWTIYRGIRALPAGSIMWIAMGRTDGPKTYFSVRDELSGAHDLAVNPNLALRDILLEAVRDTVSCHLVADVPVSIFLSAGMDSTSIASHSALSSVEQIQALTLAFGEYANTYDDEVTIAEETARRLGMRHSVYRATNRDFETNLGEFLDAMDQPSIDGLNTFFICKAARQLKFKVALSGIGGDELFGGYPSFSQVPVMHRLFSWAKPYPQFSRWLRHAFVAIAPAGEGIPAKFAGLAEYGATLEGAYMLRRCVFSPWEVQSFLENSFFSNGWRELMSLGMFADNMSKQLPAYARVAALEIEIYLRNQLLRVADWAGMAHSVEVRAPLVDIDLFRRIAPLLVNRNPPRKIALANSSPSPFPNSIIKRAKTGFLVPTREWNKQKRVHAKNRQRGLQGWACDVLPPPAAD